ncbi:MAG: hypothetical protein ABJB69_01770 [Spartobacteria bacterium]
MFAVPIHWYSYLKASIRHKKCYNFHNITLYLRRSSMLAFAITCCASLAFSVALRADDDEQGGDIEGTELLDVEMAMTPTTAAPAGSSIELSLETEDDDGATSATLKLETVLLPAGTYSVSVTLKSDGSTVALGSFTTDGGSDEEVEFWTSEVIPYPANFNPLDIATVSVSDASNVVLFTADLTKVSTVASESLGASITATAEATAPTATCTATASAHALSGVASGSLVFSGHGLPARTKLIVAINGITAKKVSTDSAGNANVGLVPKGKQATIARGVSIFGIRSVRLKDASGNVLLNAKF